MGVAEKTYKAKADGGDHFELKEFATMEDVDRKSVQVLVETTRVHFSMMKHAIDRARAVLKDVKAKFAAVKLAAQEKVNNA